MTIRTRCLAFALVSFIPSLAGADATGEAQALFDQGIADFQAGKTADACRELGASLAKKPDSGTKGALAVCDGKLGKIASAWQLWKDLADTAPGADLRADATAKVKELEPRLPHFVVKAPSIPGLAVTVEGSAVDLTVNVPLPVDPGEFHVTAKAPGFKDWTGTFSATETKTTAVEVPALVALPPEPKHTTIDDSARHNRRKLAVGIAIAGGASMATSLIFGGLASSKFSDAKKDCANNLNMCPPGSIMQAQRDFNSSNTDATVSSVLFAVGAVIVVGAGVVWFTAPSATETQRTTLRVTPGGFALSGSF